MGVGIATLHASSLPSLPEGQGPTYGSPITNFILTSFKTNCPSHPGSFLASGTLTGSVWHFNCHTTSAIHMQGRQHKTCCWPSNCCGCICKAGWAPTCVSMHRIKPQLAKEREGRQMQVSRRHGEIQVDRVTQRTQTISPDNATQVKFCHLPGWDHPCGDPKEATLS